MPVGGQNARARLHRGCGNPGVARTILRTAASSLCMDATSLMDHGSNTGRSAVFAAPSSALFPALSTSRIVYLFFTILSYCSHRIVLVKQRKLEIVLLEGAAEPVARFAPLVP